MSTPAWFVFHVTIKDHDGLAPYSAEVGETVVAFGGRRILMGGPAAPVEGDAPEGLMVVLEFPDRSTAEAWYNSPAYQAILGHRLASTTGCAYLVEAAA